jgi:hypothetical protein
MNFGEYYQYYLTLHTHPKCRLMHFIGQIFTFIFILVVLFNLSSLWVLIPVTPFVVYPFAWSGHYFFEKNKPAAFTNPLYAKLADLVMFKDIILRRISIW